MQEDYQMDAVFLDFAKAFYFIPDDFLLRKSENFNLCQSTTFPLNFFKKQTQCAKLGRALSMKTMVSL